MKSNKRPDIEPRHPIQVVARRSGLTPDVLRAWEKRYGVVEPERSVGGRRLYSNADISRLNLLREATEAGRRIGDVAQLEPERLESLVREDREARNAGSTPPAVEREGSRATRLLDECLDAVRAFDGPGLEAALERAAVLLSPVTLTDDLVGPLMERIGLLWWENELSPSAEHLATPIVRAVLNKLASMMRQPADAPTILVATPARQRHDIGAALAAVAAAAAGWKPIFLGADLPADEIAAAAKRLAVTAVALSIVHPADDASLDEELRRLRWSLGNRVPILVGGRAAPGYRQGLDEAAAMLFHDLASFQTALAALAVDEAARSSNAQAG
jgi:DNA-binding transcriptional MerR regulator/methylmalonyl-CoA mutase cobalamin-binding subunit